MLTFLKTFSGRQEVKKLLCENRIHFIQLIKRCQRFSNISSILKLLGISSSFFHYHSQLHHCLISPLKLCFLKHPLQLSTDETRTIKEAIKQHIHWPLSSVYFHLRKNNLAAYSISVFYKYARILGLAFIKGNHSCYNKKGIRATDPGEIIHADITEFRISPTLKAYIFIVIDNFSRKVLSYSVMTKKDGAVCVSNIHEALNFCKSDCMLLTDDGSEFSSLDYPNHLIAQTDISFSNSMIEAFNKILKYHYLYKINITSFEQLCAVVQFAVNDFNNRPHRVLSGASPNEVFSGHIIKPDSEILATLRQQRITENRMKCCRI